MGEITTILLDEKNLSLLIGDGDGRLLQMSFNFQGNFGKIFKDYGDLGLGWIYYSCLLRDIAVFGGENGKLAFINTRQQKFMGYSFDLAPEIIYSIELCWIQNKSQPKALLMVSGDYYDYNGKTDVLDVTQLVLNEMKKNQNKEKSNQGNSETDKILDNQFPAKPLKLTPQKLNKIKKDLS